MKTEYAWAKMTDATSGITCHVLETESGLFYDFGEEFTAQKVPDDVMPPTSPEGGAEYWGKRPRAEWAAYEMLRRKLNEIRT